MGKKHGLLLKRSPLLPFAAAAWTPWEPPTFELPPWCDDVSPKYGNADFVKFKNHPCTFLRDPQAWKDASVEGFWYGD